MPYAWLLFSLVLFALELIITTKKLITALLGLGFKLYYAVLGTSVTYRCGSKFLILGLQK